MKNFVFLFIATSLFLVGCKVDFRDGYTEPTRLNVTGTVISLTGESGSYTPQWQSDDRITLAYDGTTFIYYAKSEGSEVEFRPENESLPVNPSAPVAAWSNLDNGVFSINRDQTDLKLPMYAYNPSPVVKYMLLPMSFKPLASILALTISKKEGEEVSSVSLMPLDDAAVTGSLSNTDMSIDPATGVVSVSASSVQSNEIFMEVGSLDMDTDQKLLFMVPNGTIVDGGLSVTITCSDGASYTNNIFLGEKIEFDCSYVSATTNLYSGITVSSYDDMLEFANRCAAGDGELNVDLLADIDMKNEKWSPITGFKGSFNGYGHNIYNINVSGDDVYSGLFGYVEGSISRLNFGTKDGETYDGASIIETTYSGDQTAYSGIIARAGGAVTDVKNFVPVTVSASSNCEMFVGGVVGGILDGSLSDCSNFGAVSNLMSAGTGGSTGGIVGLIDSDLSLEAVSVDNCHNYALITTAADFTGNSVGGIVGRIESSSYIPSVSNCSNSGEIYCDNPSSSSEHICGGIVGYIPSPGASKCAISGCSNSGKIHSNMSGNSFIGGLVGLMYGVGITDCSNSGYVSYDSSDTGGTNYVGGIVGGVNNGDSISNCDNTGDVSSVRPSVNYVGGVAGYINEGSTVEYCTSSGKVSVTFESAAGNKVQAIGGILGYGLGSSSDAGPTLIECYNYGEVSGYINTSANSTAEGGIIGFNSASTVTNCVNEGTITMTNILSSSGYVEVGGINGDDTSPSGSVSGCVNRGEIIGSSANVTCVAGLVGRSRNSPITGCKNFGAIKASSSKYCGSLIGFLNKNTISNSLAGGTVDGVELTEENFEELAIGTNTSGTVEGIYFGVDE